MTLDRAGLCELIPHAGKMCLLDRVESWDEKQIVCTTDSHRAGDNPLCAEGELSAVHALEYAAQAMAVHGGLQAKRQGGRISGGYVVAVRDANLHVDRLDRLDRPLTVQASRLIVSDTIQMYHIKVSAADRPVAEARLTVMNATEAET